MKTHADRFAELEAHLVAHRPWKNPEVFAVAVVAGSEAYPGWMVATTSPLPAAEQDSGPRLRRPGPVPGPWWRPPAPPLRRSAVSPPATTDTGSCPARECRRTGRASALSTAGTARRARRDSVRQRPRMV
ncbi:divalent cation tolerance protein CutA [Streptomyces sp. NPDC059340]|uniref:divalent cation tolerance protein CutA n=1 Tax=Streptomyces sp. NPDC059340 TaxID=3346806 RepID=UPI0036B7FE07